MNLRFYIAAACRHRFVEQFDEFVVQRLLEDGDLLGIREVPEVRGPDGVAADDVLQHVRPGVVEKLLVVRLQLDGADTWSISCIRRRICRLCYAACCW